VEMSRGLCVLCRGEGVECKKSEETVRSSRERKGEEREESSRMEKKR
jgi:hypothetical protein